jgi:hypothetical protein
VVPTPSPDDMPIQLQNPPTEFATLLEDYVQDFEWHCFCLACGHSPTREDDPLQALYEAQARWRGHRMQELYPLVCAHWDVVNLAAQIADAQSETQWLALDRLLREAKSRHRAAAGTLRRTWDVAARAA